MKRISSKDAITHAAADLTHALLNLTPTSPITKLGEKQTADLRKLVEVFTKAAPPKSDTTSEGAYPRDNVRRGPCATYEGGPKRGHIIPTRKRTKTTISTCAPNNPI